MADFPSWLRLVMTWMNEEWYNYRIRMADDPHWMYTVSLLFLVRFGQQQAFQRPNYESWIKISRIFGTDTGSKPPNSHQFPESHIITQVDLQAPQVLFCVHKSAEQENTSVAVQCQVPSQSSLLIMYWLPCSPAHLSPNVGMPSQQTKHFFIVSSNADPANAVVHKEGMRMKVLAMQRRTRTKGCQRCRFLGDDLVDLTSMPMNINAIEA
ncbi:hypothetical protein F4604DRAFT_1991813 [Suillus subluteus]|nr:hypothetical protein F4604DRAFT_1991813 [Suillus subluteus]